MTSQLDQKSYLIKVSHCGARRWNYIVDEKE